MNTRSRVVTPWATLALSLVVVASLGCPNGTKTGDKSGDGAGADDGDKPGKAPPAHLDGRLDEATRIYIGGWAWDVNQPDKPVSVDIYDGGKKLTTVVAEEFREDLKKEGIGNGKHGFSYKPGESLADDKPHRIWVRFAGTEFDLPNSGTKIK